MDELERRELLGPHEKANTPSSAQGRLKAITHWNWQDDLGIASQVGDVAVEGHPLLHSTSLADSQGHAQDGVCTKLGWNRTELNEGMYVLPTSLPLAGIPAWTTTVCALDCILNLFISITPEMQQPPSHIHSSALHRKRKPVLWSMEL